MKKTFLLLLLFGFSIPTYYALRDFGYFGFFGAALTNSANIQVYIDLSISLLLINLWMLQDVRRRGDSLISLAPYLVISLLLGAFGPLLYLLQREFRQSDKSEP
jgi:hypothetical protein